MDRNGKAIVERARTLAVRALCLYLLALPAAAQTIRPLLVEYMGEAKGRFELVNNGPSPVTVVLEAKSFTVSETGDITYRDLDPKIHLKLSAMSFRIAPQQSYFVFYEAKADQMPAWFVVYAAFGGPALRDRSGINLSIELPHTVYILPKQSLKKEEIVVRTAEFVPEKKVIRLDVENTGATFGRVMSSELLAEKDRVPSVGFPLFPQSHRKIEVAWEGKGTPEKVLLYFQRFKLEQKLEVKHE